MKKTLLIVLLGQLFLVASSQKTPWVDVRESSNNFYQIQNSFKNYYEGIDLKTIRGWKQYKRWEYYYERRTFPHGNIEAFRQTLLDFAQVHHSFRDQNRTTASNWQLVGPSVIPSSGGGAGRLNHVKLIPGTTNQFMVAASGGGMWKFDGSVWTTSTDFLSRIGFGDVVINPFNTNIMLASSGDNDNADAPCIGMFKSTDGGASWTVSGLTSVSRIYKLLMNPLNPDVVFAATSFGIYRTTDGGATWNVVASQTNIRDLEYKPNDTTVIYAANRNDNNIFYRSVDGGISFSNAGISGLPTTSNGRGAIAVSAASPNYVYMVIGNPSNNGFKGVYRSLDGGTTWSTMATTPNLLGWSSTGGDTGGQQWYDLAIAASPTNSDLIVVGGVNIWMSQNGGLNWTIAGHWTGGGGAPYVHADIHDLSFDSNGITVYTGTDGGIFMKSDILASGAWTDLSSGLAIGQMYKMGQSTQNQNRVITGWQDNGTSLWTGPNTWTRVIGGDGMECLIDWSTDTYQYGTIYYGVIYRSSNGGSSFPTIIANSNGAAGTVSEEGDWVTPFVINPKNPTTLYVGKSRIFKTVNRGGNWNAHALIGNATSNIDAIAVAPSDTNTVYASKSNQIWKTTDDGANYTEITTGLPSLFITSIAVDEADANKIFVTLSGTSSGNKVFYSSNGGSSWTNISSGLPNLSANTIVLDTASATNAMYVGMDAGVYYRDDNSSSWTAFNTNLPNVEITELEIQYAAQKIRAVSYGRGLWESNLESSVVNFLNAAFTSTNASICRNGSVQFTDQSTGNPAPNSWTWSFPGGSPSSSNLKNPGPITYSTNGVYPVTLTVGNGVNSQTITLNNYVTVTSVTPTIVLQGDTSICQGFTANFAATGTNLGTPTYEWTLNGSPVGTNSSTYSSSTITSGSVLQVRVASTAYCAQPATATSNSVLVTVKPVPPRPSITAQYGVLNSSNPTGNQWFLNGNAIPGATGQTFNALVDGVYSVQTTMNGCTSEMSFIENVKIQDLFKVYPVPTKGELTIVFYVPQNASSYILRIVNTKGQVVHRSSGTASAGVNAKIMSVDNLAAGTYHISLITGGKQYERTIIKATE